MKVSNQDDPRLMRLVRRIRDDHEIRQNKSVAKATYAAVGPLRIPVNPTPTALPLKCYFNVRDVIT